MNGNAVTALDLESVQSNLYYAMNISVKCIFIIPLTSVCFHIW